MSEHDDPHMPLFTRSAQNCAFTNAMLGGLNR